MIEARHETPVNGISYTRQLYSITLCSAKIA